MRMLWIGLAASLASPLAAAQATIYKHVDASGRVTYSNRPMSGATVVELEPLSTIPGLAKPAAAPGPVPEGTGDQRPAAKPPVAIVTPRPLPTIAATDRDNRHSRENDRRKTLQEELAREESALAQVRQSLLQEQRNPVLIAAVRQAQQATEVTPAQQVEMRASIDRASGRIRGLQATVAEHESTIEALKKELGALKP